MRDDASIGDVDRADSLEAWGVQADHHDDYPIGEHSGSRQPYRLGDIHKAFDGFGKRKADDQTIENPGGRTVRNLPGRP